jgi:hypothetical protein
MLSIQIVRGIDFAIISCTYCCLTDEYKETSMEKKKHGPKKGAARKWSEKLKQLGEQPPPRDLMAILNQTEKSKKSASPTTRPTDLDVQCKS